MSDKEIITGCLRNDRFSQRALFDKYSKVLKTLCLRYVADFEESEDLLQEGFLVIFEKLSSYKFEGSFEGWLRKIMTNICLKHLIEKQKMKIDNLDDIVDLKDANYGIEDMISEKQLMDSIFRLPIGYRTVFNLFVLEGYSHKEIGDILNIEESTSRSQLAKAKNYLKKILKSI